MNWHQVEGNWKQLKGHARKRWGKLTDDELDEIRGRREILAGKLQERYGRSLDEAEEEADSWIRTLEERWDKKTDDYIGGKPRQHDNAARRSGF